MTVVGVGDMSGDVFGNGMLLSKTLKLRAAFDHRHIFLDPDARCLGGPVGMNEKDGCSICLARLGRTMIAKVISALVAAIWSTHAEVRSR